MAAAEKRVGTDAYEVLRQELMHGTLMPGDRLRVADLNDRYRLGLTPIREALMRLTSEGLVSWESRRGARVPETDLEEFRDMMQSRREIELLCLTKAMDMGDANWEAEIVRSFHLLSRTPFPDSSDAREAAANWERYHRQFHYSLMAACGSVWLLQFWSTLADHSERYRKLRLLRSQSKETRIREAKLDILEHEKIMQATIARDVAAATELIDEHLTQTETMVAKLIEPKRKRKAGRK